MSVIHDIIKPYCIRSISDVLGIDTSFSKEIMAAFGLAEHYNVENQSNPKSYIAILTIACRKFLKRARTKKVILVIFVKKII